MNRPICIWVAFVSFLTLSLSGSAAYTDPGSQAETRSFEQALEPSSQWWDPLYLLDYGLILAGGAGSYIGENLEPRESALFGPIYDPLDPSAIFLNPDVGKPYREHGVGERVPTTWVMVGGAGTILMLAGLEGTRWATGSGSGDRFHQAVIGSLEATALTAATTSLLKPLFGRLRPDFGERARRFHCSQEPDRFGDVCEGYRDRPLAHTQEEAEALMRDGRRSFVSGHSTHSFNLASIRF